MKDKLDVKYTLEDSNGNKYTIIDTQRVDLQEELNEEIKKQAIEIERLNSIIKEAIEYMERYMFSQKENYDYIHLLDILKGVDKE